MAVITQKRCSSGGSRHAFRRSNTAFLISIIFFLLMVSLLCLVRPSAVSADGTAKQEQLTSSQYLKMASDAMLQSKYQDALNYYSKALPLVYDQNQQIQINSKRAEIYWMLKKYDMALETLKVIQEKAEKPRIQDLKLLVQVEMRLGKFQEALHTMELLREVAPDVKLKGLSLSDVKSAKKRLEKVRASFEEKPSQCLSELSSLISTYASDAMELRLLRAECAILQRSFKIAAAEIKTVLKHEPLNTHALALYSRYLYKLGAIDKAKQTLRRCLSSDPDNKLCMKQHKNIKKGERLLLKAEIKLEDRKYEEAIERFEKYLALFKDSYNRDEVLGKICSTYVKKKDIKKGIPECTRVIDQMDEGTDTYTEALLDRAELHFLEEDGLEEAEKDINKAKDSQPQETKRIRSMRHKLERLKKMASRKDYYKILGIPKTATKKEIKKAYRKMAIENHPDRVQGDDNKRKKAEKKMRDVTEAYEVLSDPEKKRRFDSGEDLDGQGGGGFQRQHGFHGFPGGADGPFTFHFGGGGGGGRQQGFGFGF